MICNSGTAALHLSMLALGISRSLCVNVTYNFVADANAARFVGADVAFTDIEEGTANIDPNKIEEVLQNRKI